MIRDRGNIKWTSMMLPEHVKILREWAKEDEHESKPELDEQQLEQMNDVICESMTYGIELAITYFEDIQHRTVRGVVHYVDEIHQTLRVVTNRGEIHHIPIGGIIEVRE